MQKIHETRNKTNTDIVKFYFLKGKKLWISENEGLGIIFTPELVHTVHQKGVGLSELCYNDCASKLFHNGN